MSATYIEIGLNNLQDITKKTWTKNKRWEKNGKNEKYNTWNNIEVIKKVATERMQYSTDEYQYSKAGWIFSSHHNDSVANLEAIQ